LISGAAMCLLHKSSGVAATASDFLVAASRLNGGDDQVLIFCSRQGGLVSAPNTFPSLKPGSTKMGKYHCTIDLLFGLVCFANKNKNCQ
jgi:hypothetical protein